MDFLRHMQAQGVTPLEATADHVKMYKRALLEAGRTSATVARRLSVLRGTYRQLAAKGLISWETAQDIGAVKAPEVQKNSTPYLTKLQAVALIPLQGRGTLRYDAGEDLLTCVVDAELITEFRIPIPQVLSGLSTRSLGSS